jgi:DNA gyrase subunit A
MNDEIKLFHPNEIVQKVDIEEEMRQSFLDYSMSVIVSRALPDVRDGLKPVHRRILYSQHENGLTYDKPYHKCASTVGSVLGDYHPHGDASVYDALVRLAQNFSMRYPLVDGHGNFGSVDGDPPAAYRYTESRLAKISNEMLRDIGKGTVDFVPNYDDNKKEPAVLPSRFPNLLINGSVGIAVGMATNIPPHNLCEVIDAVHILIQNPDAGLEELMAAVKGPDFPTGGTIMGVSGIRAAYATGRGKITLRCKADIEEHKTHTRIVVTEIPYMVNKSRMLEHIGDMMHEKRLEGIATLRDESDRNGMKIVFELKRDANPQVVLNHLYSFSQLQDTIGINMLALVDGEPRTLALKEMLEHYLLFQEEIITRRTKFDLDKAGKRAHILAGLLLAADYVDEVIHILRGSKNIPEGKQRLLERFADTDMTALLARALPEAADFELSNRYGLTQQQADAIVAMTLGSLTGLEREKVSGELSGLIGKISEYKAILSDRKKVLDIIAAELDEIKKKFSDPRRTDIEPVSGEVDIEDLIPNNENIITCTSIGYIKRQATDVFNLQKRGGKGVSGMKRRDEDAVVDIFAATAHDNILFMTNLGNMYKIKCYEIPEGGRQSRGTTISALIELKPGEHVTNMMKTDGFTDNRYCICVTKNGIVKRMALSLFKNIRKSGVRAIVLEEGDEIAAAHLTEGDSTVLVATRNGRAIRFDEKKLRPTGRVTRGVRAIRLREGDFVVGAAKVYDQNCTILTVTEKGLGRRTHISAYPIKNRGGYGVLNYKIDEERGFVCGIRSLYENDDVILISDNGIIIRIRANDLNLLSRYSRGVRVMRLMDDCRVVTFARTEHDESAEISDVEHAVPEDDVVPDEADELEDGNEGEEAEDDEEAEQTDEESETEN